ncbi:MAG TPA: 2Fe-2S iron-sulfur cluster-binding protein [Streptosporangiaceae bacterium]
MDPDQLGPRPVRFSFDGTPLDAARGMTIGGALVANGILAWSLATSGSRPRGIFCGTGNCFDCLVDVGDRDRLDDRDRRAVRACLVLVRDGDQVGSSGAGRRSAP